jgi:hypothetical protein
MFAEGVSENPSKQGILVFPNPVRDMMNLYFYLTFSGEIRIEIIDLLGRKVFNNEFLPDSQGYQYISFDINNLASGYYVLQISQGQKLIGRENILIIGR